MDAIKFATTREMYEWMEATKRDGLCSVYDGWTWGHLEVTPDGSWRHVPRAEAA